MGTAYAVTSPRATVHGKRRIFVFAGRESKPPSGGLIVLDPKDGSIDFTFPWRSRSYKSVTPPRLSSLKPGLHLCELPYRRSAAEPNAGRQVQRCVDFSRGRYPLQYGSCERRVSVRLRWTKRTRRIAGCVELKTRKVMGREVPEWQESITFKGIQASRRMSTFRGTLLAVDGQFLCLGEMGNLLWLDLSPKGIREIARAKLFTARENVVCSRPE